MRLPCTRNFQCSNVIDALSFRLPMTMRIMKNVLVSTLCAMVLLSSCSKKDNNRNCSAANELLLPVNRLFKRLYRQQPY